MGLNQMTPIYKHHAKWHLKGIALSDETQQNNGILKINQQCTTQENDAYPSDILQTGTQLLDIKYIAPNYTETARKMPVSRLSLGKMVY